ncbi:MAG TPA: hypothetical protein VFB35_08970 [Gaiellaceae bacterium]|nr:hypothetical protein [Gaiellaceae bacterium]
MGAYEIGSDRWMQERIQRGLDPAESDRPDERRLALDVDANSVARVLANPLPAGPEAPPG